MPALPDQLPSSRTTPGGSRGGTSGWDTRQSRALSPVHQVAGGLGLAGVLLGLTIVIFSCAGFSAAGAFSPAVLLFGLTGIVLIAIANYRYPVVADSAVLASLFLALLCIIGGLLELVIWW